MECVEYFGNLEWRTRCGRRDICVSPIVIPCYATCPVSHEPHHIVRPPVGVRERPTNQGKLRCNTAWSGIDEMLKTHGHGRCRRCCVLWKSNQKYGVHACIVRKEAMKKGGHEVHGGEQA